ncbi:MAG: hypothetical protein PUI45_02630, partial [Spirochaetales bacterium]|nr:hypothetical protein [Spirochaetales bacterium]
DYNVFSTQTGTDGSFTVSKIVWNTSSPVWGKDNDRTKLYMMYYSKDATLLKDDQVYSIVSGSTNQAKIRANLKKCFITFPGVTSYIRDMGPKESNEDIRKVGDGRPLDDGRKLALYVQDANSVRDPNPDNKWIEISQKTTAAIENSPTSGETYYTHGNFTSLGRNARLKLIYDDSADYGYIKYYIKDVSEPISGNKVDMYNSRRFTKSFTYASNGTSDTPKIDRSKTTGDSGMYGDLQ